MLARWELEVELFESASLCRPSQRVVLQRNSPALGGWNGRHNLPWYIGSREDVYEEASGLVESRNLTTVASEQTHGIFAGTRYFFYPVLFGYLAGRLRYPMAYEYPVLYPVPDYFGTRNPMAYEYPVLYPRYEYAVLYPQLLSGTLPGTVARFAATRSLF